ncbi:MAG TPA: rRNA maturation RNase YbeY, partial [Rhizomicrobium sp.]|nr:rRNA maturation RNase YbeY [Rhizomicrobium sp.]
MTRVTVLIEDSQWRRLGRDFPAKLRRAAHDVFKATGAEAGNLTILLTDDAKLEALNTQFRGKEKPTNVLSFPAGEGDYLGDIAVAYGVAAREAQDAGKSIHDHALHLAVHGVLHLLGYDHESAREARIM